MKRTKSFIKRHPIWTGIIIFFAVYFLIGVFSPDNSDYNESLDNPISTEQQSDNNSLVQEETPNDDLIDEETEITSENIKLANWNLQILGDTKSSNPNLMNFYSSVIDDYDIVFVQEIRDIDTSAFYDLCNLLEGFDVNMNDRRDDGTRIWEAWSQESGLNNPDEFGDIVFSSETVSSGSACNSPSDANSDGVITISELINYIGMWKAGDVLIGELITAIGEWKGGC